VPRYVINARPADSGERLTEAFVNAFVLMTAGTDQAPPLRVVE
jgi:hypothetical protein